MMTHSRTDAVAAPQSVVTLSVGGPGEKCMRPVDPDHLKEADLVFTGTVTSQSADRATLRVTHTFKGEAGSTVQVRRKVGYSEAISFAADGKYLVTASDGEVADCLSGLAEDPSLRDSYQKAFPG